jgi:hypothetical protein
MGHFLSVNLLVHFWAHVLLLTHVCLRGINEVFSDRLAVCADCESRKSIDSPNKEGSRENIAFVSFSLENYCLRLVLNKANVMWELIVGEEQRRAISCLSDSYFVMSCFEFYSMSFSIVCNVCSAIINFLNNYKYFIVSLKCLYKSLYFYKPMTAWLVILNEK